ncbi:major capsid protein [Entomohabitans teleogrylli]|uniref:major capsid protein n=1 Tax=Entomohabitans teleogrylli TaxID=1384589 RepID=UPI00073DA6BF|nr:major capsid protein [Entomohabitans teleogrylli]
MYFDPKTLATNSRLRAHWDSLWGQRNIWNTSHRLMVNNYRGAMDTETLAANSLLGDGLGIDFWKEVDNQIIQLRDQEIGMEIVNDLMSVQTVLPIGKTAKLYNFVGDIADDVAVSIDGQAPYSFDHTDFGSDGDPIPVFTAGYGVNWRLAAGLNTVGIDLVLESQSAKMRKFNKARVSYYLDGSSKIQVANYPAQGLRNHRNTAKINLGSGAGGANIDLTTATPEQLLEFFGPTGPFGMTLRANKITALDKLWLSDAIWANVSKPYVISVNGGSNALLGGTVLDAIRQFIPARDIAMTYALTGNELLGYERRQDVVSPLVGMAVGTVPVPRTMPQHNYNFQIMSAEGLQVKRDAEGHSGVIYGANLG